MQYFIPIHSVVDVITNSSTVIYTEATSNSINLAKQIIDSVLKASGYDKTVDDLFNFKVSVFPSDLYDYVRDRMDDSEFEEKLPDVARLKLVMVEDWKTRRASFAAWHKDNIATILPLLEGETSDPENGRVNTLIVTTKDGVDIGFAEKALAMFYISSEYNG